MVAHEKNHSLIVEQLWWNSGTDMVEQYKTAYGTEEQLWWNSGTMMVEQWNSDSGTEEK